MLLHRSSQVQELIQGKSQRLELTGSLHDYFALHPKYYNSSNSSSSSNNNANSNSGSNRSPKSPKKSVKFMDYYDNDDGAIIYHDLSASSRSLTSISDECISLDQTQHVRRPNSDSLELDRTSHHRSETML